MLDPKKAILILAVALSACAAVQSVTLLPRGSSTQPSTGSLDRMTNELTVKVAGKEYRGPVIWQSAVTTPTLFGHARSTYSSQASALLLGEGGGQIRCDLGWDAMMTTATGVCVDNQNNTYDLLIKN